MEIAPGSDKASEIVSRSARMYLLEAPVWRTQYDEIEDGYNYLAGEQYTPTTKEWYKSQRRPTRPFNLVFPIFNQVMGDFILNDNKIRVYPKPGGTSKIAHHFENILDQYNFDNDSTQFLAKVGLAGLNKVGVGYPRWSDELDIAGSLVIDEVDEFEMIHDSRATKDGADDAMYWFRSRMLTKGQIMYEWSHHRDMLKEALHDRDQEGYWGVIDEYMTLQINHPDFINEIEGKYRILEFHEIIYETAEVITDMHTGYAEIWSLEGKKADLYLKAHPDSRITKRRSKVKKIHNIIPALNFLLDSGDADIQDGKPDYITFNAYNYGKRTIKNFGIFKNAKEPQDDFNEWRNTLADLINKAADPGHTFRPDALENPEDVKLYGRSRGVNFMIKPGHRDLKNIIIQNKIPTIPFGPDQMSQEAAELLMKITGVTANFMGTSETRNEPASLFAQRVQQAKVALVVIYNNWQRFKRRLYQKSIRIVQEHITHEQVFFINNPKTFEQDEIIVNQRIADAIVNDLSQGRYGVVADDMENNPGAKSLRFIQKTEVIETVTSLFGGAIVNPAAISAILDWWLSDSDLGDIDKFIEAFSKAIQQEAAAGVDAQAKESAFMDTANILDLAKKQLELTSLTGITAGGNGGPSGESPTTNRGAD